METILKRACSGNGLRSVSVMLFTEHKTCPLTVYVHWGEPGEGNCASGSGETFDEALFRALGQMAERRLIQAITEAA